jgi:hypothetical protein
MAWQAVKTYTYTGASGKDKVHAYLEYNDADDTAVRRKFRWRGGGSNYYNGYYILWDPNGTNEKIYMIKNPKGDLAYNTVEFYLEKGYTDTNYNIPAVWLCNTGSVAPDMTARTIYYDNPGKVTFYNCFNVHRTGYRTKFDAITNAGIKAENNTATAPTITDLHNASVTGSSPFCGSCSITGAGSRAGTNNSISSTVLQYKIGSGSWTNASALSVNPLNVTASSGNTVTVKARTVVTGTYNSPTSSEATLNVTRYAVPSEAGEPTLHNDSFKNKRLILKHNWKWTWTASTAGTTASPVKGYRIQLKRCRPPATTFTAIAFKDLNGKASDSYNAMDISTNYFEMNPLDCDLQPGDKVSFAVKAFTQVGSNNTGTKLFRDSFKETSPKNVQTVQNAGVLRYKPTASGEWVEAVVWYKKSNTEWVEAEVVKYKPTDSGEWKEST